MTALEQEQARLKAAAVTRVGATKTEVKSDGEIKRNSSDPEPVDTDDTKSVGTENSKKKKGDRAKKWKDRLAKKGKKKDKSDRETETRKNPTEEELAAKATENEKPSSSEKQVEHNDELETQRIEAKKAEEAAKLEAIEDERIAKEKFENEMRQKHLENERVAQQKAEEDAPLKAENYREVDLKDDGDLGATSSDDTLSNASGDDMTADSTGQKKKKKKKSKKWKERLEKKMKSKQQDSTADGMSDAATANGGDNGSADSPKVAYPRVTYSDESGDLGAKNEPKEPEIGSI